MCVNYLLMMTSKMRTKLVRCPKCLNLLGEPQEVSFYQCGGCGAILQPKKPNNTAVDTPSSQRPEDDNSGKLKMEQVSIDQEAGNSSNQPSGGVNEYLFVDFNGEETVVGRLKFFKEQQIAETRRFIIRMREEAQTFRNSVAQLNALIAELEGGENPGEVWDSIMDLRDDRVIQNNKLAGVNDLITQAEEEIEIKWVS